MSQPYPITILRPHTEDVAHDVNLELVKVAVDASAEQCLELVRAIFDFVAMGFLGVGQAFFALLGLLAWFDGGGMGGWPETERGGGRVEETLFDAVEGALGEDVDAVDYVV